MVVGKCRTSVPELWLIENIAAGMDNISFRSLKGPGSENERRRAWIAAIRELWKRTGFGAERAR